MLLLVIYLSESDLFVIYSYSRSGYYHY